MTAEAATSTALPADTMHAVVRDRYGEAEVLGTAEVRRPEPAAGEVLVRVRAAGLDRGTWHVMTGTPYAARLAFGLRTPRAAGLGIDLAGTVVEVGAGVSDVEIGDEVFGFGRQAFAEYAVARADRIVGKPVSLSFEAAAVLPISGGTALQACDLARITPGMTVLIVGASGGVGSYAVQIAVSRGATVTGVASTAKLDFVRSLGAAEVLDYTLEDFANGARRYDAILDIGGSSPVSRLRRALTAKGALVIVGGEDAGRWLGMGRQVLAVCLSPFVGQRLTMLGSRQRSGDLERLCELVESAALTPALDRTYPMAQAREAMARLVGGAVRGKIALVPRTSPEPASGPAGA